MLQLRSLAGVAAGLLIAGTASAGSLGTGTAPALNFQLQYGTRTWTNSPTGVAGQGTTFDYDGSRLQPDRDGDGLPEWNLTWDVNLDPDPFLNGAFSLTNTTTSTQTYVLTVLLPVSPAIPGATLVGGSIAGSLTDANASGFAELRTLTGVSLFKGLNDLGTALTIYNDPSIFTANLFAGQSVSIPAQNVGLPVLTNGVLGPAALSNIAIQLAFTLTAGDSASFTAFYQVEPVPEPTTVLLFGMGLAGLAVAGRRRS